jgi:hypothetical protein
MLYAALKRRSSTVLRVVRVGCVKINIKVKGKRTGVSVPHGRRFAPRTAEGGCPHMKRGGVGETKVPRVARNDISQGNLIAALKRCAAQMQS